MDSEVWKLLPEEIKESLQEFQAKETKPNQLSQKDFFEKFERNDSMGVTSGTSDDQDMLRMAGGSWAKRTSFPFEQESKKPGFRTDSEISEMKEVSDEHDLHNFAEKYH